MKQKNNKIKSTSYTHFIKKILYKISFTINILNTFQHINSTNSNNI